MIFLLFLQPSILSASPKGLLFWDFNRGFTNVWGGSYNVYTRQPSWARTYLDPDVHHGDWGYSLRVTVHKVEDGFCGIWMDMYPNNGGPPRVFDASHYKYLSFWIKGVKGNADFSIVLNDEAHEKKHAGPAPVQKLSRYLRQGITSKWQEVLVPLADFDGLNPKHLSGITIKFHDIGDYEFYLDDFAFKEGKSSPVPSPKPRPIPKRIQVGQLEHAMWLWHTKEIFHPSRPQGLDQFFAFCKENRITEIYLNLDLDDSPDAKMSGFALQEPDRYRDFIVRAHRHGLKVDGLSGAPSWAVRANHHVALAVVDVVLKYNRSVPQAARFDGIHFDVEPYLLVGYFIPALRKQILKEYLEMVQECAERTHTEPNLQFSCDIPSWFYSTDPSSRQKLLVKFNGQEKTVGEHVTDLLNTVTIMDYRNEADGAGGIVSFGSAAMKYAASQGKKIVVGLETSTEGDRTVYFVSSVQAKRFEQRLIKSKLLGRAYYKGYRISTLDHDDHVHVGLSAPDDLQGSNERKFEKALVSLVRLLGSDSSGGNSSGGTDLNDARAALRKDPEWKGFEAFQLIDPDSGHTITGFSSVRTMLPKITFYGLGGKIFREEVNSATHWLSQYPSFAGFAYHHYDSLRALLQLP